MWLQRFIHICWKSHKLVFHPASKAEAAETALKKTRKAARKGAEHRVIESSSPAAHSLCSRLFSLASVPLINSWLSSVTNVSLPSSSPGEEGGVFNVQFVLWIDVCWHRLSPSPAPCVIYCTITKRFLRAFPTHFNHRKPPAGLTDTRRSTYVALMDTNGWWKETIRTR